MVAESLPDEACRVSQLPKRRSIGHAPTLEVMPWLSVVHSDEAEVERRCEGDVMQRPQRRHQSQLDAGPGVGGDEVAAWLDRQRQDFAMRDPLSVGLLPRLERLRIQLVAI